MTHCLNLTSVIKKTLKPDTEVLVGQIELSSAKRLKGQYNLFMKPTNVARKKLNVKRELVIKEKALGHACMSLDKSVFLIN